MTGGGRYSAPFLPEDLATNILLRLPVASCIGRFRCVCRSWRTLLSDPNFIQKILFFRDDHHTAQQHLLITGHRKPNDQYSFSLHSYDTILRRPAAVGGGDLASVSGTYPLIDCYCDGIFCLIDMSDSAFDPVLWNPTTSEIKRPPDSPFPNSLGSSVDGIVYGMGIDPRTKDYKVVRAFGYYLPDSSDRFGYAEVYSLRNDSWEQVILTQDVSVLLPNLRSRCSIHQQEDASRHEKCYWLSHSLSLRELEILSFDMGEQVFEFVTVPNPGGRARTRGDGGWPLLTMVKGSLLLGFEEGYVKSVGGKYEVWGLLKCGVAESWTKLYRFATPPGFRIYEMEIWNYPCCAFSNRTSRKRVVTGDITTTDGGDEGEIGCLVPLAETAPGGWGFTIHSFTPNSVALLG